MQPSLEATTHPLLRGARVIDAALDAMAGTDPLFLSSGDRRELLVRLARLETRMAAVRLRTMAVSDDLASAEGARDIAALLTHDTRGDAGAHRRELSLAESLERRWDTVAAALAAGDLNVAQAVVITRALDDLPDEVTTDLRQQAEERLVAEAAHHGPRDLRVLGRRILDILAPDVAEQAEARLLDAEEHRARETTSLTMTRLGDGTTRVQLHLPDADAARLGTYLDAFTSPRRHGAQPSLGEAGRVPHHRRQGLAFCALLEAVDPQRLPVHAGDATTVIITVPLAHLTTELATAGLLGNERLSAAQARRLACTAKLVPAVLGGASEVLDLGRSSRLFTAAQRKALLLRDHECRAQGCTIPATWCEAHHAGTPWARGGRTDLAEGLLLCSWHHHRAHDPAYDSSRLPNGDIRFSRRC